MEPESHRKKPASLEEGQARPVVWDINRQGNAQVRLCFSLFSLKGKVSSTCFGSWSNPSRTLDKSFVREIYWEVFQKRKNKMKPETPILAKGTGK